jgi:hypothetical protein
MAALDIEPRSPASDGDLQAFEKKTGLTLTPELREIYRLADGIPLLEGSLTIMSLAEVEQYPKFFFESGSFPLVDNCDSDPWCVTCDGTLQGFVIQVCHDDVVPVKVKFRSIDSFFAAIADWVGEDNWDLSDMPCDFDRPERTPRDIDLARKLLANLPAVKEDDRSHVAGAAVVLLSEQEAEEIGALLTAGDDYIRQHARRRLMELNTPAAKAILDREDAAERAFIQECMVVLSKAGIPASLHHGGRQIRVEPNIGLNMGVFVSKRKDPDAFDYLLERCKALRKNQGS